LHSSLFKKKGFADRGRARYEAKNMNREPKGFVPTPYPYHHELELEISDITNLGVGIGRDDGWVVQVPYCWPGEKVRVRIFRNHANYSQADLVKVIEPSSDRIEPHCSLYGICGGCQYQGVRYDAQLRWKREQVENSLVRLGGLSVEVKPVVPSPRPFGYRSKLTPHFQGGRQGKDLTIGFLRQGSRKALVDVAQCPIATDAINQAMPAAREELQKAPKRKRGGTLLLREVIEGVVTDPKQLVSERVGELIFHFKAGEFFQNNPYILPKLVDHVVAQAKAAENHLLVDAYCGGGLFGLSAAAKFEKVIGIEISREGFEGARTNTRINRIENAEFFLGDACSIFEEIKGFTGSAALVIDPPRRGCDPDFLRQAIEFSPQHIVYVSCEPATQARDARTLVEAGYQPVLAQPFDLFPQTRHVENVLTLVRS
jgi:23S rRNA (uracil1939-C5)-methyltransferase